MQKILKYMGSDNKLFIKLGVVLFLESLLIFSTNFNGVFHIKIGLLLLSALISILLIGYKISIVKFMDTVSSQVKLPFLNIKKHFIMGFKYIISFQLFYIPVLLVAFAFTYYYILLSTTGASRELFLKSLFVLMILSIILFVVACVYIIPAATLIYLKTNRILSFYMFKEIFNLAKSAKKYVLYSIIYSIIFIIFDIIYVLGLNLLKSNMPYSLVSGLLVAMILIYLQFIQIYNLAKIKDSAKLLLE